MDFNEANIYINKFYDDSQLNSYYDEIINFKNESYIPAVRLDTALFLKWIVSLYKPKNILEIGFGSGVSTVFIHNGFKNYENLISLERDTYRYERGLLLLKKYKYSTIKLLKIDAFNFFEENNIKFDFIFLDAVKREYYLYIEPVKKILNIGGILITDNILFNGKVFEENIDKKYINGVKYLKLFNHNIFNDKKLNTIFLMIGDGLSLSIRY